MRLPPSALADRLSADERTLRFGWMDWPVTEWLRWPADVAGAAVVDIKVLLTADDFKKWPYLQVSLETPPCSEVPIHTAARTLSPLLTHGQQRAVLCVLGTCRRRHCSGTTALLCSHRPFVRWNTAADRSMALSGRACCGYSVNERDQRYSGVRLTSHWAPSGTSIAAGRYPVVPARLPW